MAGLLAIKSLDFQSSLFIYSTPIIIPPMYLVMYVSHVYIHIYVCLYISEVNDNNGARHGREEVELFCYYNLIILYVMCYSVFESGLGIAVNVYCKLQGNH